MNRKSGRGLLNYTTQIKIENTVSEIELILSRHGARKVLKEYDGAGGVSSISFTLVIGDKEILFKLPMNEKAISEILNNQATERKIPRKFLHDIEQARRVGWRIIKSWVEAQMAIIETRMVKIEEVFLPYAWNPKTKQTYFQQFEKKQLTAGDYKIEEE